jgi:hypothetical protein
VLAEPARDIGRDTGVDAFVPAQQQIHKIHCVSIYLAYVITVPYGFRTNQTPPTF